jgi:hypothetical protein
MSSTKIPLWSQIRTSRLVPMFSFLHSNYWFSSLPETSLFVYQHNSDISYLLLCVHDDILTASSQIFLDHILLFFNPSFL